MHRPSTWALVVIALSCAPVAAGGKPVVQKLPDRGRVDWTRGVILAEGGAAADLTAPRPEIKRIRAERIARERAAARLADQARSLPVAGGGTVGDALAGDDAAQRRFDRAVERALDERVEYGSDGSVVVVLALPVEAVRGALAGPSGPPGADEPTGLLIAAGNAMKSPELGLGIRGRDGEYSGATVFYRSRKAAAKDARLGDAVVQHAATSKDGRFLVVDAELDLGDAHPLVVVVIGK